jgi:hypothetical protein
MPYKNPERKKEHDYYYRLENAKQRSGLNKRWNLDHPKYFEKYYQKNKDRLKQLSKKWRQDHPNEWKKSKAKHRRLGFVPLNKPFKDSDGHHLDKEHVLYIPKELHSSIRHCVWTGWKMKEINAKALKWLKEQFS